MGLSAAAVQPSITRPKSAQAVTPRLFHARAGRIGGMEKRRKERGGCIVAFAAIAVLFFAVLSAYVVGYFGLCIGSIRDESGSCRLYAEKWQATIYRPAASIESLLIGKPVDIVSRPPDNWQRLKLNVPLQRFTLPDNPPVIVPLERVLDRGQSPPVWKG
jgi:nitrate reductase NapE component